MSWPHKQARRMMLGLIKEHRRKELERCYYSRLSPQLADEATRTKRAKEYADKYFAFRTGPDFGDLQTIDRQVLIQQVYDAVTASDLAELFIKCGFGDECGFDDIMYDDDQFVRDIMKEAMVHCFGPDNAKWQWVAHPNDVKIFAEQIDKIYERLVKRVGNREFESVVMI